jgi:hypothetical protein
VTRVNENGVGLLLLNLAREVQHREAVGCSDSEVDDFDRIVGEDVPKDVGKEP